MRVTREKRLFEKAVEQFEARRKEINEENPFYWYLYLRKIGKNRQTKEMVEEAVNRFDVENHACTILEVVARKHLTRDLCEIAVSRNGLNLKYVPPKFRDADMYSTAVESDGRALEYVPECDRSYELCLAAIHDSFADYILEYVPKNYKKGTKGRELCEAALRANGRAFHYIPNQWKTKDRARMAIEAPVPSREILQLDGSYVTESTSRISLEQIPPKCMSEDLVALAVRRDPRNLEYASAEYVSRDLYFEVLKQDPMNLQYIQTPDEALVDYALERDPRAIKAILYSPLLTVDRCRKAMLQDPSIPIDWFPEDIREELRDELVEPFIAYPPTKLEMPLLQTEVTTLALREGQIHDLTTVVTLDDSASTIYYITDLHLEHQLELYERRLSKEEVRQFINGKIYELVPLNFEEPYNVLLIGGDVADSVELEALFYKYLPNRWHGKIITVLGNHELWDGDPTGQYQTRPIDEIIDDYRETIGAVSDKAIMLENALFVDNGIHSRVLEEQEILDKSVEELSETCTDSKLLVLGGTGFSGLDPQYNAECGLYRKNVTIEEDMRRSDRFRQVYEKVLNCAENIQVIVLTHMPMRDWTNAQYNPKWIYVNGHTHHNGLKFEANGPAVFSDNQVGYEPIPWRLKGFRINERYYDPLKRLSNGIHPITRKEYHEFNVGQGIQVSGELKHAGDIYALKHDGVYMFFLVDKKRLCLLEGGNRRKLDYDIEYYRENLPEYVRKARRILEPYFHALSMISQEVKTFGGDGTIHGCIVDIDFYNHLFVNPNDGKITSYFARDKGNPQFYGSLMELLKSSPMPPKLEDGTHLYSRYIRLAQEKKLPILSEISNEKKLFPVVSDKNIAKKMYSMSGDARSIQYLIDKNVVRRWEGDILSLEEETNELNASTRATIRSAKKI